MIFLPALFTSSPEVIATMRTFLPFMCTALVIHTASMATEGMLLAGAHTLQALRAVPILLISPSSDSAVYVHLSASSIAAGSGTATLSQTTQRLAGHASLKALCGVQRGTWTS